MAGRRTAAPTGPAPEVVPERPPAPPIPAHKGEAAMPKPAPGERFPRSKFLEASTLGIGALIGGAVTVRSEERRVGKECRSRWSPEHEKKKKKKRKERGEEVRKRRWRRA